MSDEGARTPHAGINAGPVIERDLDVFGQTVNRATRIADVAAPGEVLASEASCMAPQTTDPRSNAIEDRWLKGLPDPGRALPGVEARIARRERMSGSPGLRGAGPRAGAEARGRVAPPEVGAGLGPVGR